LPQEVKELGAEEAIIFYEGLRPIRARKIRYYQDRRFTARLLPPPERAAPAPPSSSETPVTAEPQFETPPASAPPVTAEPQFETPPASAPPADWKPPEIPEARPATREATVADIDRLETLTLEDFAVDFDRVKIPQKGEGERLSSEELNAAVESFLDTLKTR
jgi:type IV secretion system protein VirD4